MNVADFADAIIKLFPPFRWDEETHRAWTSAVVRECGSGFDPDVRGRAFDELVRVHDGSTPRVAALLSLCREAQRRKDTEHRKLPLEDGSKPDKRRVWDYSEGRTDTVMYALRRTPLAKRALKEGWHLSFRDFVRVHGAIPATPAEIKSCIDGARDLNEGIGILQERLKHIKPKPEVHSEDDIDTWVPLGAGLDQSLLRLGMSMLKKRDEVARIIEGGQ